MYSDDAAYPVAPQFETPELTWPFEQVNATAAWSKSSGSSVRVGIVDQGLVFAHEDLNVAQVLTNASIYFPAEHATRVAGIACAKGKIGTVGMAWGCPIVTAATGTFYNTTVLEAVTRMAKEGDVKVVNISLGNGPTDGGCATAAQDALIAKWDAAGKEAFRHVFAGTYGKNIVWTIAAGNNCSPGVASEWGANSDLPNVIAVAATNSDGSLARFSNYGDGVNVAAPGGMAVPPLTPNNGLMSTIPVGCPSGYCSGYDEEMGTSFAAPMVAGIAADVWEQHPSMKASEVRNCITSTAGATGSGDYATEQSAYPSKGWTPYVTYPGGAIPIVDAGAAVECSGSQVVTVSPVGNVDGPVGYGGVFSGPACGSASDTGLLSVYADNNLLFSYIVSGGFFSTDGWQQPLQYTYDLEAGTYQLTFECLITDGTSQVEEWSSPGFEITLTGTAREAQAAASAPQGGSLRVISGVAGDPCPIVDGVAPSDADYFLLPPPGNEYDYVGYTSNLSAASYEALLPSDLTSGETSSALVRCSYPGGASFGFAPTPFTVTAPE